MFHYPKSRHVRKQVPPVFTSYRRYKPFLQTEFDSICVYCRTPDFVPSSGNFGVEHYLPKSKFPELENVYSNLFFACNACNRRKGAYYPDTEEARRRRFVPNQCDHTMYDHLRMSGATVNAHSDAGKFTIELLGLNDEGFNQKRSLILVIVDALKNSIHESERKLSQLKALIDSDTPPPGAEQDFADLMNAKEGFVKELTRFRCY